MNDTRVRGAVSSTSKHGDARWPTTCPLEESTRNVVSSLDYGVARDPIRASCARIGSFIHTN
jgi:hypothetical protein